MQEQFEKYLSEHLNLRPEDIKKIEIHKKLRDSLKKKLELKNAGADEETYSFLTGSYVRNTTIRPPKDVDFFRVENRYQIYF